MRVASISPQDGINGTQTQDLYSLCRFFDLAWGSKINLFHHGFARVSEDPAIVAATMAKPGVVLRRPVGSNGAFGEPTQNAADDKAARKAALAFEKEQKRCESEHRKEAAAWEKERQRRERAIAAAEAALEEARREHEARAADIDKERVALDRKPEAEDARWRKKKQELETALREAQSVSYLWPVG